jgi:hypothetical protein
MTLAVSKIQDQAVLDKVFNYLKDSGFKPTVAEDRLHLEGVGFADRSVDLGIEILEIDGHRVLEFSADISESDASFERVSLAVVRGNSRSHIARFLPVETSSDHDHRFRVMATCHVYADHFSRDEISSMTYLFVKEVDEIDNELRSILKGQ